MTTKRVQRKRRRHKLYGRTRESPERSHRRPGSSMRRNKKAPMPELVISGSGTGLAFPPPPAAFQPALKILKRATTGPALPSSSAPSPADVQKSYAEREAKYQAARQRIFNDTVPSDTTSAAPPGSVTVIRPLRGPSADASTSSTDSKVSRGFTSKRGGRGTPAPRG